MNRLIVAEGLEDFSHLARHMSHFMHRVMPSGFSAGPRSSDWTPAVDICETEQQYEIVVELAGVQREDIEVFAEGRDLTVQGWRGDPTTRDKTCLHQMEIEQGQFCRRLPLPEDAETEDISARYRDGLLRISIPKRPVAIEEADIA